jgi:hypothetical protein
LRAFVKLSEEFLLTLFANTQLGPTLAQRRLERPDLHMLFVNDSRQILAAHDTLLRVSAVRQIVALELVLVAHFASPL